MFTYVVKKKRRAYILFWIKKLEEEREQKNETLES